MTARLDVYRSITDLRAEDVRSLYDGFDSPVAALDCGRKCAAHSQNGKPFCCDICHAVPAAYTSEWKYLEANSQLWHKWRGDECHSTTKQERARLKADTPDNMVLLACLGPSQCEREFRALSCRQFPFFPYVTSVYRFIGMACEWEFESKCWVISNLGQVTQTYRQEFVRTYDRLFALFQTEFDSYAFHSEKLRAHFADHKRRFPLLHRNWGCYLVSPRSQRLQSVDIASLPRFGPYR